MESKGRGMPKIIAVPELNETEILRAFQDRESPLTEIDALMALVAERILLLGIDNGEPLILPTGALLLRTNKEHRGDMGKGKTLSELYGNLSHEGNPTRQMEIGMELGDKGIHIVAGIFPGSNRKAFRLMNDETLERYAGRMAITGYSSALSIAEKGRGGHDMLASVTASVPKLIERYWDIIKILKSLREKIRIAMQSEQLMN